MIAALIAFSVSNPIRLWTGDAPLAKGKSENDVPTLTPYLPDGKAKSAVVVCPGGGYWMLADHEGKDYAEFLAQNGVAAYVLRYRLGQFGNRHPAMVIDAQRAIRTVRNLGLYEKIGIMGSSAGGHLAASASTLYASEFSKPEDSIDLLSARPDFTILCYPVISMVAPLGHVGSGDNLLGKESTKAEREALDPSKLVNKNTPPAFLWHTGEDTGVPPENSVSYAMALRKAGVHFDLHVFQKGRHGIGLADKAPYRKAHPWSSDLIFWLKENGWR
jgi:acetyl esterase/lipase